MKGERVLDLGITWLPIIGGTLLTFGVAIWFGPGGNKTNAIWLSLTGVISLAVGLALHLQKVVWEVDAPAEKIGASAPIGTRTYLTMSFGAVLLNSPTPGEVTAWIRIKNTGTTPAFKTKGWIKFQRGLSDQNPFNALGEPTNEVILGAGQESNLSSTLSLDAAQLALVKNKTLSFYLWGRVEYLDETKQSRFLIFKGIMNGPPATIVIDGVRAEGWGFAATIGGMEAN